MIAKLDLSDNADLTEQVGTVIWMDGWMDGYTVLKFTRLGTVADRIPLA